MAEIEAERHDIHDLVEPRHHRAEIVFGIFSFCIALILLTQIGSETQWLDGKPWHRQPSFWPAVSIAGMTVFGALELIFSWRRNATGRGESITGEVINWLVPVEYAVWFMAYVLAVPAGGYLPVTLIFCTALARRLGYRTGRHMIAALLTGLATVVLFKSFLAVKIPGGAVYEFLPDALRNFMILYL